MRKNLTSTFFGLCALLLLGTGAKAQISAQFVGRYSIGNYSSNGGAAEITAFDAASKRMFVINGPDSSLRIVNISNPALPVQISKISIKPYGIDLTSVACKNGLVAVAVIDSNGKTNPSSIVFMDINGNFISKVKAGANADNIVFTPDGSKLLVANEGEPNVGYTIDPEGSVSIINLAGGAAGLTQANVQTAGFTAFNAPTVIDPKIRIFGKIQSAPNTFLRNSTVAEDMEPEYITISDDGLTAWVTCQENNCVAVVNINTATITSLLPLGFKNHNIVGAGLDPSDKDGAGATALANIGYWPVFGLFLPDGISSYKVGAQTYFITANEGDSRADWGSENLEEVRMGDPSYVLDTVKFGGAANVAALKANAALGRLNVTNRYGDFDNDGKFDSIFTFGGRGFSIWNATTGAMVWDSKDEFERKTLAMFPANFNTGHTTNALDDRSDNKGPEPESVTIGKIKDSTYAFVALERIGGIMIYNITDPIAPYFVQYINSRNFSVAPSQANLSTVGDLGPEGIVFIPASESPNGQNMIMLSNEVSSTVAFYSINTPETQGIAKLQDYTNRTSAAIGTFQGINYKEAGFSTLFPIQNTNGTEFWTCSDRGVNIDCANANTASCRPTYDKMYAFPSYTPKIHRIRITGDSVQILQTITIKRPNGTGASGIINPTGLGSTATEVASTDTVLNCANFSLKTTPKDTFGIDPEGLVVDKNGNFWLCEEGGATIWVLNPNGVLIKRYTPYANLAGVQAVDVQIDSVFKYRKNNRGFEGISIAPNGKIYAIIQSPMIYPSDNSRVQRILEIDPATGNQRMIVYLNDGVIGAAGANQIRLNDWKIGDMSAVNDSTFLVLEAAARGTTDIKRLYQININQATAVHSGLYGGLTLEGLADSTGLANNGIKAVTKTLVIDLLASGWPAILDKAEGLAIINDSTIAIANDNDFGQKSAAANGIATATGNLSHVITYTLSGARKLTNYKPAASSVSSQSSYLTASAPGVKLNAILTTGDAINGYKMAGTPDGLGAYDNGNGTFTILMNHEFGNTAGVIRAHGSKGAFVSKWVVNKNDLSVVSGADLIKRVNVWNTATQSYTLLDSANASTLTAFNRFCSADLPAVSAFFNATTGNGTQERIFMNGEEAGNEGRALGHIATGTNAGTSYELPALGKFSWENSVASPIAQDKTIVAGMDDSTPGQVYIYIGTKTNAGTEIEKAGLTNGKLYGIAVTGLATEVSASTPAANTAFTLVDLGVVKDSTGASLQTRSNNLGVTSFLRPEDGAWDPSNPNDFYFATTNAITAPSRLWRAHFTDIKNPELGGTITAVLDGTEGQKMLDNLTIDKFGHVLLVEDVGGNVHIGKTWQYTIATDQFVQIAAHDSSRFISGRENFLTQDEEASGILDVQDILGAGNFLVVDQAHYSLPGELVEGGQLLKLFNPATANSAAGALASSSQSPYLTAAAAGVKVNSILTAGDDVTGYKMAGTPDGLGAYDNGNGTFTILMNHEFGNTAGVIRAHGSKGAFVSKWVVNKSDLSVVSGADLIKRVNVWNTATQSYILLDSANASSLTAFNRFCSADLPAVSAFFNATTGKGTQERIVMNGEEAGNEGRALGHIATGTNAGTTYELPALGKFSWENSVASPIAQDKTIVAGMDDSTPGQVYIYIGTKTNAGTEIEKAGLTNGKLYGIAVTGLATEVSASIPAANTAFTLVDLGVVKDSTGASLQTRSNNLGVTSFLRPEDGAWDPSNPNDFYFATTNAITAPSRLWRAHFTDIKNPELGGTITAVLDGTEGQKMLDNLTIDKYGHVLLVEDVGGNVHLGKTWQYTIATDKFEIIASHDSTRFLVGGANYLTQDEEASGILDVEDILGAGSFLVVDQAHYSLPGELVEGGQLLKLFNPATANGAAGALASSSQTPYLTAAAPGVKLNSILTTGDAVNGYKMAGTPDGLGAYDNGNGTFTILMNHEFGNTAGAIRAHGSKGAFVSKWVVNKNDLSVVSGADLIKRVKVWNTATQSYTLLDSANASTLTAFNRFCSADLPAVSAFFNATSGNGTQERIFMNGEEAGNEGRALAHIATGTDAGTTYELPALGKFSWENSVASPIAQDKTIVAGMDDSTPGQVYIYIGTKTNTGTDIEKAGLTNGKLYGIAVTGLTTEVSASFPAANTAFTLVDLGNVKDSTGASLNTRSNNLGVTSFLRPEDGAWDPSSPNDFYFATTNAITAPSRLWRAHFTDIKNPELGGTITAVLDGTEGQKMLDNLTIDKSGHILLVEDVGGNVHIGKTWQYTIATDQFVQIASHDSSRFIAGRENFLTQDEEASGILDVQDILGAGNFLVVDQAHYALPGELVEGGQLLKLFNPASANGIQLKTIAQARTFATDTVKVKGIVTRAWGRFIYIQDSTGAIGVRQASGAMVDSLVSTGIKEGDLVEVVGARGDFNNYAQIALRTGAYSENSRVTVLARNQQLPPAKLVTLKQLNTNAEQYESQLVKVVGLKTAATGNFAASTNYTIWDGTTAGDTMVYRVIAAADTEVDDAPATAIPTDEFSFEGTLIQFCSSPTSGCTSGYQLQGIRKYEIKPVVIQTIAQARALATDTVRVRGIVTRAWGRFIYIQDATGAIGVRQASGAMVDSLVSAGLKEGDSVEVVGGRSDFNNYAQIGLRTGAYSENSRVKVLARNQQLPAAKLVTLKQLNTNGEQYESQLVKVVNLQTAATGTFAASTNYTVWDGSTQGDTLLYRVISGADTEMDDVPTVNIPATKFTFEGTLIQFCASPTSGCVLGYQLQGVRKYEITVQPVPPTLSAFNLTTPVNNTRITTTASNTTPVNFKFTKSNNATSYKWFIAASTGNFTSPWVLSGSLTDSAFNYTRSEFDTLVAKHGIVRGDSVLLKWTAFAYLGSDSLMASQTNNIWIVREAAPVVVPTLNPFNLLTPANNSRVEVEHNDNTPIEITWSAAATGATYKWLLDAQNGNFSSPWANMNADVSGTATKITLTSGAIDAILDGKSVADGDSASLIWTVRAYLGTDSLKATQTFAITVIRKKAVGLYEANLDAQVNLYPNPTSANTILSLQLESAEKVTINVSDIQGKAVLNTIENDIVSGTQTIELPTSVLQNGIYFVNIQAGEKSARVKLVIMH